MSRHFNNCFCCGHYLVPRYKRLVNHIFQANPEHGFDKNALEPLRHYALVKPEKLDKSFRYMSSKIARYLRHNNRPYVIYGIKAMTDTMKSCSQQLNTFVDHYLETLQLVLEEGNDLELIEQVVMSFESFCEIREEAPSHRRNYQFFVDRFTHLCHYSEERTNFRCLGLRGHHALIRKTANDELQNDAWKHIDQIVPSIILNMSVLTPSPSLHSTTTTTEILLEPVIITEAIHCNSPQILAAFVLRDLFCRAHSNNISMCTQAILTHLDAHGRWSPCDFPKYIFSQLMMSIKHHNSFIVINLLLNHLEKAFEQNIKANIRTSVMNVIHDCLVFAAPNTEVGPTLFAKVPHLLKLLQKSFHIKRKPTKKSSNNTDERLFQNAVIQGIEDFADRLTDFQLMEVFQCIVASFPKTHDNIIDKTNESKEENLQFQLVLFRTIQKIILKKRSQQMAFMQHNEVLFVIHFITQYTATNHLHEPMVEQMLTETTFPRQLFDPLIDMMSSSDAEIRFNVLEILQLLIDREHYADKFNKIRIISDISQLNLCNPTNKSHPVEIAFLKKFGHQFCSQLHQCIISDNNTKKNFYAIYSLMNVVTIHSTDRDALVDIIHFCFEIQTTLQNMMKENPKQLLQVKYHCIYAIVIAFFNLMSRFYNITNFVHHVDEIALKCESLAPYLLPPHAFRNIPQETLLKYIPDECFFCEDKVRHALESFGYNAARFDRTIHHKTEPGMHGSEDCDEPETDDSISSRTDLNENHHDDHLSFGRITDVLYANSTEPRRTTNNGRLINELREKNFQDIKRDFNQKKNHTNKNIEQLLNVRDLQHDEIQLSAIDSNSNENNQVQTNRFSYPELFTY